MKKGASLAAIAAVTSGLLAGAATAFGFFELSSFPTALAVAIGGGVGALGVAAMIGSGAGLAVGLVVGLSVLAYKKMESKGLASFLVSIVPSFVAGAGVAYALIAATTLGVVAATGIGAGVVAAVLLTVGAIAFYKHHKDQMDQKEKFFLNNVKFSEKARITYMNPIFNLSDFATPTEVAPTEVAPTASNLLDQVIESGDDENFAMKKM